MCGLRTIKVRVEFGTALTRLALAAHAGNARFPVCSLRVELTGDASGFFDIGPAIIGSRIDRDFTGLGNGDLAVSPGDAFFNCPNLTGAGGLSVSTQALSIRSYER